MHVRFLCIYARACVCMYCVCIWYFVHRLVPNWLVQVCVCACALCVCTYMCLHVLCIYTCKIHMYACEFVCVYVHIYNIYIYIYIYIYIQQRAEVHYRGRRRPSFITRYTCMHICTTYIHTHNIYCTIHVLCMYICVTYMHKYNIYCTVHILCMYICVTYMHSYTKGGDPTSTGEGGHSIYGKFFEDEVTMM
jgi:hypothetical protein